MASGWNLWVWLVSVVVRRYIYIIDILIIIITFPYSTCINSFFGSIIPISLFIFKKMFFCTCIYIYVCHASGPGKYPFKCATRKRRTG